MTTTRTTVSFKCSCGSPNFDMPRNPKASDQIRCTKCGATARHGDLMRQATAQVAAAVQKKMKEVFRKAGFK